MVAVLGNIFGTEHLQMVEDVVQDALVSALENWKFNGLPDNPRAWLYRTAKNKAIDIIRRNRHSQVFDFSDPERQLLTSEYTLSTTMDNFWEETHIKDDFLGMMFACCHPELTTENQITFMLKSLCGFSTKEVARAFVTKEDTISKRLYRTKSFFRKNKFRPTIPAEHKISARIETVLRAIYLIFNEGYNSTHASNLIRDDLIAQAMFLCKSLLGNEKTQLPEVYALMGLICFHCARSESRLTPEGELILLAHQDRSSWNQELIEAGNSYLNKAAFGKKLSAYHLEAAIAYEHCTAKDYTHTNWEAILGYYDTLLAQAFDPIIFLNRSIVLLQVEGLQAAFDSLLELEDMKSLQDYYLYHAVWGEIQAQLGNVEAAKLHLQQASQLTGSQQEKRFLAEKMNKL